MPKEGRVPKYKLPFTGDFQPHKGKSKEPRYYPADDVPAKAPKRKQGGTPKLRASITPGTVLILLSGRFRGKRVVFLKQLKSGLLLVTGPYKINGVPLRRVNQAYVIATSYKVNVGGVNVGSINDEYFARVVTEKGGDEDAFFASETKVVVSDQRKNDQTKADASLKLSEEERDYLRTKFSLGNRLLAHELKF